MAQYAQKVFGQWQLITGSFLTGAGDDALQRAINWPELTDAEECEAEGVYEITALPDQPSGVKILGTEIVDIDGRPAWAWSCDHYTLDEAKAVYTDTADAYRDIKLKAITSDTMTRYTPSAWIDHCYMANNAVKAAISAVVTDADDVFAVDVMAGYPQ